MINFRILAAFFEHLEHYAWFGGFGDLNSVELLVVKVDPILIVCLAHFAGKGSPLDRDAVFVLGNIELLAQPSPEAEKVDVLD